MKFNLNPPRLQWLQRDKRHDEATALMGRSNAIDRVMAVIEFSPDGVIQHANANFLSVVGYDAAAVVGQHHRMFVDPEYAKRDEYQAFWHTLARGEFHQGQYQRFGKGHTPIWLEASYNPVFDALGNVIKIVKFATDITQHKQLALDREGQIKAIHRSQGVIEFSLDGTVITANDLFLAVVGYTLDEIKGQHHRLFVDQATAASPEYQAFWQTLSQGEFISGRFKRVNKQQETIWLEATYNPIFDTQGKPYKVVKYATDITQLVAMEQRAKTLSLVADETNNSVIITDARGCIEYVNNGFTLNTGYVLDEVIGKRPGDLLQGKLSDPDTKKRMRTYLDAKQPFYEEIINYGKNGQPYWISLTVNPVFNAKGDVEKFVSIQANINEMKLKQLDFKMRSEAVSRSTGLIEFTADGVITMMNDNFAKVVGYSQEEVIGRHHSMFVTPQYAASAEYREFWRKLNNGLFDSARYFRVGKAGREIWIQATYNPICDQEGRVIKVVKFATDITAEYLSARALESAVKETQLVVNAASQGALFHRIGLADKTGAISEVCRGINTLMDNITDIIHQVRAASETINTAAHEISLGNQDLSGRTEQQAHHLEKTAGSMQTLASTVKQNADNALQANQMATLASEVAVYGGQVVGNVVSTMRAINDSAKKIEDIISVIDGIAFQTNILSLNAAVEAARAGEQGRGFAVVATEVRNLAQRSASAAREIKDLITDSVNKTSEGSQLVANAGNTMAEVVHSVQRVADIISQISAASNAQHAGIDQVNNAVLAMDASTQQNAALVDEAAAAAASLVDQADQLTDVIRRFQLTDTAQASTQRSLVA